MEKLKQKATAQYRKVRSPRADMDMQKFFLSRYNDLVTRYNEITKIFCMSPHMQKIFYLVITRY